MERIFSLSMIKIFLFHCVIILPLLITSSAAKARDQDALLAMKAHITHDPTNSLAKNWNTSISICNWVGVTCYVRSHRVSALNLSSFGLTGTIPSQLGNLSTLQTLDLHRNRLSGAIPFSLFTINTLQFLDLSNNHFSAGSFPSFVVNESSLQIVDFTDNILSGELPMNICNNLPFLIGLYLSKNNFYGDVPSTLSNCKYLEVLSLSLNNFSGVIPKEIGNLTKLKELYLGFNKLQGEIPQELGSLAELEVLSLASNDFSGVIPKEIGNLTKLYLLYLRQNKLQGKIPQELGNLIALEILSIPFNNLTGEIPQELGNLAELEILQLQNNFLTGTIPLSIFNLSHLTALDLSYNRLTGEISHEIGSLHNLELLVLSQNNLVGVVPVAIFNISSLMSLQLQDNSLSGSLSSSGDIRLPNLEELLLWENNFSGTIPNFIFNASGLARLDLQDNAFSGFIPSTFGKLTNLKRLSLYTNNLKSSTLELSIFMSSLSNCKNLEDIDLSDNPLDGILPRAIGNLSHSLKRFVMFGCNISGGIPEEISSLANLTTIDLGGNRLNGSIPNIFGRLRALQLLNLPENELEGSIPYDICHLDELYKLFLQGNKLSGSIPPCFDSLTSLRELSLSSNKLVSVIPSTLWNLKDILYINFSSNFLSGPLPLEIEKLKVLIGIDLSMNNLSGVIPTTIGELKNLQYLSLEYNRLQGSIPDSFGDLINLISLNLSNNNLSGAIPVSLEKLLELKYLNLSFNELEGKIPSEGPFANFSATSFLGNDLLCGSVNLLVPPCKTSSRQTSRKNVLLLKILLPSSIAFIVVVIVLIFRRQKTKKELPKDIILSTQESWRRFSYLELVRATNGFNENNLVGKGSFGSVYKASLQDGMEIAVKVFHLQFERALKSFDVECEVMKSIRHRNIVKIISSCSNDDFKALVLEYMSNGSLEKCLYSINCTLDISQRLNIMIDVASALEYLHFGTSAPIIHCDLKPSNVLLDNDMVAHLSDFSIAKLLTGQDQYMAQTQTLATIGYMAPEYGREGQVSTNGDVYSFGIMLMETFTKKKPTDEIFTEDRTLKCWVNDLLPISVMEVVDMNLLSREGEHFVAKEQCASSLLNLAIECVGELPEERINAKEILRRLSKIRDTLLRELGGGRWIRQSNSI